MKILLDECIPIRLKQHLIAFEVHSVSEMGWKSLKNGNLMRTAIEHGFDVLLTVDKNLQFQQNIKEYEITIVVFDVLFNRLKDFVPLIPSFIELLATFEKKKAYLVK